MTFNSKKLTNTEKSNLKKPQQLQPLKFEQLDAVAGGACIGGNFAPAFPR